MSFVENVAKKYGLFLQCWCTLPQEPVRYIISQHKISVVGEERKIVKTQQQQQPSTLFDAH